jgi:hypothetical protein
MSNYTKTTDFEAKDSLPSGDSGKIIRGSEFETEFDNIATAIASKSDANNPTFTGTVTIDGLTVNGNTVLGNAATDTVTVTADIASNLIPSADDTYNLGASGAEWNDLYVDGVAYIDTIDGFATTGNITFGDNDKVIFGASSDLQIYHTGSPSSNSVIEDAGAGNLLLKSNGNGVQFRDGSDSLVFNVDLDSATTLYHNTSAKLATTSTGIDVTGTVTAGGLTSQAGANATDILSLSGSAAGRTLTVQSYDTTLGGAGFDINASASAGEITLQTNTKDRLRVEANGDISFYEDTGTTAKFFWDASAERLGLGTDSPAEELHIAAGYPVIRLEDSNSTGNAYAEIQSSNGDLYLMADQGQNTGSSKLSLWVDASERMRIDSAGRVGIGTTSPGRKLTIQDTSAQMSLVSEAGSSVLNFGDTADDNIGRIEYSNSDNSMRFRTNTADAMRIDSSGNVGIGNTNPGEKLEVRNGHVRIGGYNSGTRYGLIFTPQDSGSYRYIISDSSDLVFGKGIGSQAETLTAEHVRIDADGNVGIGTDSPQGPLQVQLSSARNLVVDFDTEGDSRTSLRSIEDTTNRLRPIQLEGQEIVLGTAAFDQTVSSEAMRIDSSGNLLVGTTSAVVANSSSNVGTAIGAGLIESARAGVVAQFNRHTSDGEIIDFQRAGIVVGSIGTHTIIGSSRLYVGSGDVNLMFRPDIEVIQPASDTGLRDAAISLGNASGRFKDLYLSGTANVEKVTAERTNGVCAEFRRSNDGHAVQFFHAGSLVGSVAVTSTATAYNTSSDQRLKENIADADDAGSKIDAIQVRKFDWIADGSHQDYGMVAQELNTVAPEAVTEGDTEEDMMSVDYSKLVPMLVKEIQSLRARVAQLETN